MKVVIANFSPPVRSDLDFADAWRSHEPPPPGPRVGLFEYGAGWGFHIYALGIHLLERGLADDAEFWDFGPQRGTSRHPSGVLRVVFHGPADVAAYVERFGAPDLYVQHGGFGGLEVLQLLEGRSFRVYVPALRQGIDRRGNFNAECFLVDAERYLDRRSTMYVPVVNTAVIRPGDRPAQRDLIYLSEVRDNKRHDILLRALRGTDLTAHLHPVRPGELDLRGTRVTTSAFDEADVVELLQTSRIAVYPGDNTSSPAAMWECVAAGLPIVVNRRIVGGGHLVVPGVTGEFASGFGFGRAIRRVLRDRDRYRPRAHFEAHWDTRAILDGYVDFFARMGWRGA